MLKYLVFLFPLWFGFIMPQRLAEANRDGRLEDELTNTFLLTLAVVVTTPALWMFFDPPTDDMWIPLGLLLGAISIVVIASALLIKQLLSILWRKLIW